MADGKFAFDHYRILTDDEGHPLELGRGAMGITYRGIDTNLDVEVALKVINPQLLGDESTMHRFLREARSAASLRHPNVASVFHLGEAQDTAFYAMEFVAGETLTERVKRTGPLGTVEALTIAGQVAYALTAAEKKKVVHRDIKPDNIMIERSDDGDLHVKLIDFGLAKNLQPDAGKSAWMSMDGFVGTPVFSSPEQIEEKELDTRSDIYSLGISLWYTLTGRPPFEGSISTVMRSHFSAPPPLEKLKGQPEPVRQLLSKMLGKEPDDRHRSATVLRREIQDCIDRIASSAAGPSEETGERLSNRYDRLGVEFESSWGVRHLGWDGFEHREVILDLLNAGAVKNEARHPLLRTAVDSARRLVHPHVVHCTGFERCQMESGEVRMLVILEQNRSVLLSEVLGSQGALRYEDAVLVFEGIVEATDALVGVELREITLDPRRIQVLIPKEWEKWEVEKILQTPFSAWPSVVPKVEPFSLDSIFEDPDDVAAALSSSAPEVISENHPWWLGRLLYRMVGGQVPQSGGGSFPELGSLSDHANRILQNCLNGNAYRNGTDFFRVLTSDHGPVTVLSSNFDFDAPTVDMSATTVGRVKSEPLNPEGASPAKSSEAKQAELAKLQAEQEWIAEEQRKKEQQEREEKERREKEAAEVEAERVRIATEKAAEKERVRLEKEAERKEKERLAAEAKARAEQEAAAQKEQAKKEREEKAAAAARLKAEKKVKPQAADVFQEEAEVGDGVPLDERPAKAKASKLPMIVAGIAVCAAVLGAVVFWPDKDEGTADGPDPRPEIPAPVDPPPVEPPLVEPDPPTPERDHFAENLAKASAAWKGGNQDGAAAALAEAAQGEIGPITPEDQSFLLQVIDALDTGQSGADAEGRKRWQPFLKWAKNLKIEGGAERIASVESQWKALAAWEAADKDSTAAALADFAKNLPKEAALPAGISKLLDEIVADLRTRSDTSPGAQWEPGLTLAVEHGRANPGARRLLADTIFARDPSAAAEEYKKIIEDMAADKPSVWMEVCLEFSEKYPEGSDREYFKSLVGEELGNLVNAREIPVLTREIMDEIGPGTLIKAAESGVGVAMWIVGDLWATRIPAVIDSEKKFTNEEMDQNAFAWYLKASDAGYPLAQFVAAECYMIGRGVEKDTAAGIRILEKIGEEYWERLPAVPFHLAENETDLEKQEILYEKTVELYETAVANGRIPYYGQLGRLLIEGKGGKQELERGYALLEEGSEKGDKNSKYFLGLFLLEPNPIQEALKINADQKRGSELIRESAILGHSGATKWCVENDISLN